MNVHGPEVVVNDSVVFAELDNEAVLLNVESGVYFGLDDIGTEIWNLLSTGATQEDLVARLAAEYEVGESELRDDVSEFIRLLQDNGLVQMVMAEAPR